MSNNQRVYTVKEAADHLGLAVSTLNKWRCIGGGPRYLKLGKAVRYRLDDLHNFSEDRCINSTSSF